MSLSVGIVGLPNVGKSTLFNALTRSKQANVQNYPFCTIDPNVGVVEVPDERLVKIGEITKTEKIIPTVIEFVDIAGLVAGASKGEGLGNQFLARIREVNAIVFVLRAFSDQNIINVQNKIDPKAEAEILTSELVLADLVTLQKKIENLESAAKNSTDKEAKKRLAICQELFQILNSAKSGKPSAFGEDDEKFVKELNLLSLKPKIYVLNVDEKNSKINTVVDPAVPQIEISAKLEAELADLPENEAKEYLRYSGKEMSGLDNLIKICYQLLSLITFFTFNEKETRAWTAKQGTKAPEAAGIIHTDFIKGFIKADVVDWHDFVNLGGWSHAKESGKMRLEGKDYIVRDGDVIYFNVKP